MENIFKNANLTECYEYLIDLGINDLQTLNKFVFEKHEQFEKHFPRPGDQIKIENICKKHATNSINNETVDELPSDSVSIQAVSSDVPVSENVIQVIAIVPDADVSHREITTRYTEVEEFNLQEHLKNHCTGRAVLRNYTNNGFLDTQAQNELCDIIVTYFLSFENIFIDDAEIHYITVHKIIHTFPKEITETYYIPAIKKAHSKNNKSGMSKGKLVSKFRNKRTFIRVYSTSNDENIDVQNVPFLMAENISEVAAASKVWLAENTLAPLEQALPHWQKTYSLRLINDNLKQLSFSDALKEWPILSQQIGVVLIGNDFLRKFQTNSEKFKSNWVAIYPKLLKVLSNKLKPCDYNWLSTIENNKDISEDTELVLQFMIISSIVSASGCKISVKSILNPPTEENVRCKQTKKRKSSSNLWKPSSIEQQKGILLHIEDPSDLEYAVNHKFEDLQVLGLKCPPFIVIVGCDLTELELFYVYADKETRYEFQTFFEALEYLFQLYLILCIDYPVQSENICYFIQWGILEIKKQNDIKISFILNTMNKCKAFKISTRK